MKNYSKAICAETEAGMNKTKRTLAQEKPLHLSHFAFILRGIKKQFNFSRSLPGSRFFPSQYLHRSAAFTSCVRFGCIERMTEYALLVYNLETVYGIMTLSKQLFQWLVGCLLLIIIALVVFGCSLLCYLLATSGDSIVSLVSEYRIPTRLNYVNYVIVQYVTLKSSLPWCFLSFYHAFRCHFMCSCVNLLIETNELSQMIIL